MADHNCRKIDRFNPFAEATRILTLAALGKTPREFKAARGLPEKARTGDHMDRHERAREPNPAPSPWGLKRWSSADSAR
jgi:hypothetical protein